MYKNKFREKFNISRNTKLLLCVARYDPMKDHVTLLKSFENIKKSFSDAILILAGSGTEKFSNIDKVINLGAYTNINEVYSASDIIISSSAFGEGFSNAIGEGMASGLIPVSTNVGDAKFIIKDTGKIVDIKDHIKLSRAVLEVFKMSEVEYKDYKLKARNRIINYFSKEKMIKNYNNIYKNIIFERKL